MITAKIRDPQTQLPFMEFVHGTTCIVGVPHGAQSELWVTCDTPCTLVIEAAGRELEVLPLIAPGDSINISRLEQPLVRQGSILQNAWDVFRRAPRKPQPAPQRLYNFRAVAENGTPLQRGDVLATFDFHLLCEVDFHWARAFHLKLKTGGGEGSIAERAEGTCPSCSEVRSRQAKDWRYET
jgi:hypothetical protein